MADEDGRVPQFPAIITPTGSAAGGEPRRDSSPTEYPGSGVTVASEVSNMASRYATLAAVLREDEAVLHRAWIAHRTVHKETAHQAGCDQDCEAEQVLREARDKMRELHEASEGRH